MTIKVICSWCGCCLGSKETDDEAFPGVEQPISHSICARCMEKALSDIRSVTVQENKPSS